MILGLRISTGLITVLILFLATWSQATASAPAYQTPIPTFSFPATPTPWDLATPTRIPSITFPATPTPWDQATPTRIPTVMFPATPTPWDQATPTPISTVPFPIAPTAISSTPVSSETGYFGLIVSTTQAVSEAIGQVEYVIYDIWALIGAPESLGAPWVPVSGTTYTVYSLVTRVTSDTVTTLSWFRALGELGIFGMTINFLIVSLIFIAGLQALNFAMTVLHFLIRIVNDVIDFVLKFLPFW